ncbi:glycosyltransferase family 4 protein [Hymenobacter sp.]|uniref:glycosyltransferase family 4 protein n=1 Tax=Hymenobacter sp. TaxID=1898978 RepID=UPI002ED7DDA4
MVVAYLRQHYQRYDLLHLHGSELQLPAMTAGLAVPQLLSVQGLVSQYIRFVPGTFSKLKFLWALAGYYERRYLPAIHHFSCRTHWDKAQIRQLSPGCTVHHNWEMIRPEFFGDDSVVAPVSGRPQLLFMGGSQELKGFRETLAAFKIVRAQVDVQLVIVGRVNDHEMAAAIAQTGLRNIGPNDVQCRQFVSAAELAVLFRESFCLLHPSHVDNSPNSVCEAQVAGLPVIAANVGGVSSLVEHEQTGLLCDLNPATIARQVLQLCHNPALRQRLIAQARTVAWQRHNPATVVQRTVAIYHAVYEAFHQTQPGSVVEEVAANSLFAAS